MAQKITALRLQKRNHQRVNVFLDGEFAFGLERIVAAWLKIGMELSDEKIAQLRAEDARETAYQQAIKLIHLRSHSMAEIRQNLTRHSVTADVITYVMERLGRSGLIDDARFAREWVSNRTELHPRGQRALAFELKRKGIEPEIIQEAVDSVNENELAYQAAVRQSRKIKNFEWKEFRQKMLRHLAQRGFDYETSADVTRRVWEDMVGEAYHLDEGTEP